MLRKQVNTVPRLPKVRPKVLLVRCLTLTTDAEGNFEFRGLQPGEVELQAMPPELGSSTKTRVKAGERAITLKLSRGALVKGRVVGDDGKGLSRFRVNEQDFTTSDGRFELARRRAGAALVFDATGYAQVAIAVPKGSDTVDIGEVKLTRGRKLSGTVRDSSTRAPIANALVDVGDRGTSTMSGNHFLAERNGAARTDSQGRYVLAAVDARADFVVATRECGTRCQTRCTDTLYRGSSRVGRTRYLVIALNDFGNLA